jgi:hypothetical protein
VKYIQKLNRGRYIPYKNGRMFMPNDRTKPSNCFL